MCKCTSQLFQCFLILVSWSSIDLQCPTRPCDMCTDILPLPFLSYYTRDHITCEIFIYYPCRQLHIISYVYVKIILYLIQWVQQNSTKRIFYWNVWDNFYSSDKQNLAKLIFLDGIVIPIFEFLRWREFCLKPRLHIPSMSLFFVPFKIGFNVILWYCLHITLKRSTGAANKNSEVDGTYKWSFNDLADFVSFLVLMEAIAKEI